MAHIHDVWDVDPHFIVDMQTRVVSDQSPIGTTLMQYDHNSQRLTFEMAWTVDQHDMALCNRIEVHYINIGTNGKRNAGVYVVDDLKKNDGELETIEFTWLVSQNATQHAGSLSFVLKFICTDDNNEPVYRWSTAVCSDITIGVGMDNGEEVATRYADVLGAWYAQFLADGNEFKTDMENIGTAMSELALISYASYLEQLAENASTAKREIQKTGAEVVTNLLNEELGPEYLDETIFPAINNAINVKADDIVNVVLSRLPKAEGASF